MKSSGSRKIIIAIAVICGVIVTALAAGGIILIVSHGNKTEAVNVVTHKNHRVEKETSRLEPDSTGSDDGSEVSPSIDISEPDPGLSSASPQTIPDGMTLFQDIPSTFVFSSGVGAWDDTLTLNPDGTFSGFYHDTDMGAVGPDSPNGLLTYCTYHGSLSTPVQKDTHTYTCTVTSLTLDEPDSPSFLEDGVKHNFEPECCSISQGDTITIYLPSAPISSIPLDVLDWHSMISHHSSTLDDYGFCVDGGSSFFSMESDYTTSLEDSTPEPPVPDLSSDSENWIGNYGAFTITAPSYWKDLVTVFHNTWNGCESWSFHQTTSYNTSWGGSLFAFCIYSDGSYLSSPNYHVLGYDQNYTYVMEFPSDVSYNYEDKEISEEYSMLSQDIDSIEQNLTVNSYSFTRSPDDYMIPCSSRVYLDIYEVSNLTAKQLRIAKNEIYARHGRLFDDPTLQSHFNSKGWYYGSIAPADFTADVFNDYERANILTLESALNNNMYSY